MAQGPKRGEDVAIAERTKTKTAQQTDKKLQRPPLYRVILHNDDYTTREFVVMILQAIFHRSESEATAIMLHVHHRGVGVAGVYTKEIAETKVAETMQAAEEAEYPLLCTMEPDDDGENSDSGGAP